MFLLSVCIYFVCVFRGCEMCYPSKHLIVTKITKIVCLFAVIKQLTEIVGRIKHLHSHTGISTGQCRLQK